MRHMVTERCRFPSVMIRFFVVLCMFLVGSPCHAERCYVNDLPAPETCEDIRAIESRLQEVLEQARAATVCIQIGEGSGSGVIVSEDGLVLSAAHVTGGVGKKIKVLLEDGSEHEATTLGLASETDAAMAKLEGDGPFPHVSIGKVNPPRLGDWVFALGHSGGFDRERGIVVRMGRLVKIMDDTFQSDCTLIGGDSGGPLFDLDGRLVGIHSRVGSRLPENMHVPMAVFMESWDAMLASEFLGDGPFAKRPEKGNGFMGFSSEAAEGGGLRVTRVGEGSPAAEAGLKEGDVVWKFNGRKTSRREDLQKELKEMAIGDEVRLDVRRGDEDLTLTFLLGSR